MLYANTTTSQTVAAGGTISFNTSTIETGTICNGGIINNNTSIRIRKPGIYKVDFNGSTDTTTSDATVQLYVNGTAYTGALSTAPVGGDVGFTCLVQVLNNCCAIKSNLPATLTVVNTGTAATFTNAAITITKVSDCA